ncbi:pathogen-related protein-like isoform X1 [Prunus avium]|uniref:Pathogen-related protein-like isoform X1 n=1 Tax=Prunus avium TaxID=42229 RepID=A0A6P5T0G2_PRUAV|nr:pathogen-related protein-like isoform X1 [Prunus avium]
MAMGSSDVEGDKYRSYLSGEGEKNTTWRFGAPPSYDVVNKLFEDGRTKIWPPGSLGEEVQNLVKTWEMEVFHKANLDDFKTLDPNNHTFSLNGRKGITLEEIGKLGGGYNPLLQTSLPENLRGYKAFTTTFPRGFALEILHVYSGPPEIVYKFRHWGYMEGPFKGHAPTGELVEVYGMSIFTVDEHNKIVKIEFFYDPGQLLGGLLKGEKLGTSSEGTTSSCHVLRTG